ncbi:hypothetical protein FLP10_05190 [Agromyces intestinalis]|uniref:FAD-binding domain-containing protein n=1 Tax=Agromyces intestinalis TaxID=2592652 RepID=A0A5C1YEK8_9MICO|nr:FAD-dependent monooxygenase [Agromyces intestinalis]QEO13885.1 hypothetical protein FLP10_05190 [Agromyces intestinalis]
MAYAPAGPHRGDDRDPSAIVVGGGPVGLATVLELHRHGIRVALVEPRTDVEHSRPRAKTTSARTMEYFRRWGIADRVRAAAALPVDWSHRVTFCTTVTGREIASIDRVLGLDLTGSDLAAEPAQQVTQPVIEEVLRARVAELDGIDARFGWRAVEVSQDASGATVAIESAAGEREVLAADWVIGADGARSVVRAAMGARLEGAAGGRPNVNITFRSRGLAERIPHAPSIHYWVLNPGAPGVVGPLDLDGTWWAISTGTESIADDAEAIGLVQGLVGASDLDLEIVATDPWQARLLLADRYRAGRLFVVGDAAHQNPPWGGHGFNTGVGDAVNLGWKLAAVIAGWAPETLLDSYESERRPIAAQTIEVAAANMRALPIELGDPAFLADGREGEAARERAAAAILATKDAEFHADALILGYGYTDAATDQCPSLGEYRPIAAAGNRLPHRWLPDGSSAYDRLGDGLTAIGPDGDTTVLAVAAAARGIPFSVIDGPTPTLVVRPDQHLAWVGDGVADPRAADAVLDAALAGFAGPAESAG